MGEQINGIDVEKLRNLLKEVETNKEAVARISRWSSRVRWLGSGFNFRAYVRNHSFTVSEPSELGGPDSGPNAVEYVLSALGACYATGFILNATRRGVRVRNLEISLEGEIDNILVFLGLSDRGHPGYRRIVARAYVDAEADERTVREIWEETVRTSPVGNTLERQVEIAAEARLAR